MSPPLQRYSGFTLLELVAVLAGSAILMVGLSGVVGRALATWDVTREQTQLTRQGRFALDRIVAATNGAGQLLVPGPDNVATGYSEAIRDVLAVLLDPTLDRDRDGFADADNDKDGLVDEDLGDDATNDGAPGIVGVDDDNDSTTDEASTRDDDEDGLVDEEPVDGTDDDGDGRIDEDSGSLADDDGDAIANEDWLDPVVFRLSGTTLLERIPNPNPLDGTDYTELVLAENVSQFRVERIPPGTDDRALLVLIALELVGPQGSTLSLSSHVRVPRRR